MEIFTLLGFTKAGEWVHDSTMPLQEDELPMPKYEINEALQKRLENTFTYHLPQEDQPERYTALRDKAKELAILICETTPPSREQSLALTKLEEVSMHANAAIARNEKAE
jgi:Fe-S cluster biosynthesis and repair protein YggX